MNTSTKRAQKISATISESLHHNVAAVFLRRVLFFSCVLFLLSGCFLAPAIDSFNKLGVTASDRQALLEDRFRKFSDALYWGEPGEAITFVEPESRGELEPVFRRIRKQEKIVDTRIESVGFSDNAFTATIEVMQKYYRVPYYVVIERTESQEWNFHINGGWLLASSKEVKDG